MYLNQQQEKKKKDEKYMKSTDTRSQFTSYNLMLGINWKIL